jgi:amidophosphoribosyltransferase
MNESDKFRDLRLFGIYSKMMWGGADVYYGLYALQHRDRKLRIVVNNEGILEQTRGMGLVSDVFSSDILSEKREDRIGHVRYSTAGKSDINNAQPLTVNCREGQIAIAHNGIS